MSRSQKHNKKINFNRKMRLIGNSLTNLKSSANSLVICRVLVATATTFSVLNAHFWHTDWLGVLLGLTFVVSLGIEVFLSYKGRKTETKDILSTIEKGWKNVLMGSIALITLVVIILSIVTHLGWELPLLVGYALLRVAYWLMVKYVPSWQATLGSLPINSNMVDFVYLVALGLTLLLILGWPGLMLPAFILNIIPFGILFSGKCRGAFRPSKMLWFAIMIATGNIIIVIIASVIFGLMLWSERGIPEWNMPSETPADAAQDIIEFTPISVLGIPEFWRKVQFFKTEGNVIIMADARWFRGEKLQNMSSCCDPEVPTSPPAWLFLGTGQVIIKYHEAGKVEELKMRLHYPVARDAARNRISVLIDRTCEWQGVKRLGHA